MNNEYIDVNGIIIVRNGNKLQQRVNHNKIEEELKLENEIEILEKNISDKNKELEDVSKRKMNLNLIVCIFCNIIAFALGATSGIRLILAMLALVNFLLSRDSNGHPLIAFFKSKKKRKALKSAIEYLNGVLNEKKEKLTSIQNSRSKANGGLEVKFLDASSDVYRSSLEKRLSFILKYHTLSEKYKKMYRDGSLVEHLENKGYSPEERKFAVDLVSKDMARSRKKKK